MSASLQCLDEPKRYVQFTNGHFDRLVLRGVLMPAGVFGVERLVYCADVASVEAVVATPAESVACGMAMRAYVSAVHEGDARGRDWIDRYDRELAERGDEVIEFFVTCRGFEIH